MFWRRKNVTLLVAASVLANIVGSSREGTILTGQREKMSKEAHCEPQDWRYLPLDYATVISPALTGFIYSHTLALKDHILFSKSSSNDRAEPALKQRLLCPSLLLAKTTNALRKNEAGVGNLPHLASQGCTSCSFGL